MRKMLCVLLCLLLLPAAWAEEDSAYLGDGIGMLTVTEDAYCYRQPHEGTRLTWLTVGARVIETDETVIASGSWDMWHRVYVPGRGYGYVLDAHVQPEEARLVGYQPGFGVSTALFAVADADQVRVEIASLDNLEFPVITLQDISVQERDGSDQIIAAFTTAGDVCKTTRETLLATLYDLAGEPIDVIKLEFDAPHWR